MGFVFGVIVLIVGYKIYRGYRITNIRTSQNLTIPSRKIEGLSDHSLVQKVKKQLNFDDRIDFDWGDRSENHPLVLEGKMTEEEMRRHISIAHALLDMGRALAIGSKHFIWWTCDDERVRPEHKKLDGKKYRWDKPPVINGVWEYPGTALLCRCYAEVVIPDDFYPEGEAPKENKMKCSSR